MQEKLIIVPCFNEENRLNSKAFLDFSKNNPEFYFCFVNDGSTDKTQNILDQLKHQRPKNSLTLSL